VNGADDDVLWKKGHGENSSFSVKVLALTSLHGDIVCNFFTTIIL
jgi:hypothetical protein